MCAYLHVRLLGEFAISLDNKVVATFDSPRLQSLLAYLLLHRNAPQSRRYLAFLFWPESTEAQALTNLRKVLTELRRSLPDAPQRIAFDRKTIQWRSDPSLPLRLDVDEFQSALVSSNTISDESDPAAIEPLQRAVRMYAGDLLPSCYDEWILGPREELREKLLAALDRLITLLERSGDLTQSILYARRLLRHEPLLEENYRRLMRLYMQAGDRAGALNVYKQCALILKSEFGIEPEEVTRVIVSQDEAVESEDLSLPMPIGLRQPSGVDLNIPAQTTAFFGREKELAELSALLRTTQVRLSTLTGTAGTGKTRLSIQAAANLAAAFPDGVWFVPLAPITEPDDARILGAIASVMGVLDLGVADLAASLKKHLLDKQTLLVLDNFEHLLSVAHVIGDLLETCPQLKVLTTSRAPLNLRGEHEFPVPPLQVPPGDTPSRLEDLAQYDAIALFLDRALEVSPGLALTPLNLRAVADICRRLEGLPLSIELAAARVKALSPPALLARLERRLKLLVVGRRDAPSRHQTLNAAIAWSYNLLDETEKSLFRLLSVFVGGFSLEAVSATAGSLDPAQCLDSLSSLLDKSLLVRRDGVEGEPRFGMLETLKEYAWERLVEKGETKEAARRHALYFFDLAERATPELKGAEQGSWVARLDEDHDNLRAALRWAINGGSSEVALRMVGALARFWELRGYFNESFSWIQQALALAREGMPGQEDESVNPDKRSARYRALALGAGGLVAEKQGKYEVARQMLTESLELYKAGDDKLGVAGALNNLALLEAYYDLDRAVELHKQSLALRRELGDKWGAGISLINLSSIELARRNYEEAYEYAREALEIHRALGNEWGSVHTLYLLGMINHYSGDSDAAISLLEEGLATCREHNYRWPLARLSVALGQAMHSRGDYERSTELFSEAEATYSELGDQWGYAMACVYLGREAHRRGNMAEAIRLYKHALAIGIEIDHGFTRACSMAGLAGILGDQGRCYDAARLFAFAEKDADESLERYAVMVGIEESKAVVNATAPGAWELAWADGEAMSLQEAIDLAHSV